MKTKLLGLMLLAGGSMFAETRFSIGIGVGAPAYYPPAPVAVRVARPPCPGPGYTWVNPYYDSYGSWINGYWAPPASYYGGYYGSYYAAPRYYGGYYRRDFDRDDRRFERRRDFDRDDRHFDRGRDFDRDRGRGNGFGRR